MFTTRKCMFDTFTQKMRDYTAAYTKTVDAGFKHMYGKKTRVPPGVSRYMGTDLYFYCSLVWQVRD